MTVPLVVAAPLTANTPEAPPLPTMLIAPVLLSPVAITVSPVPMPVLPMSNALPFVLLLVSTPPIVRLLPPPPPILGPSISTTALPVRLSPPVVPTDAPFCRSKTPAIVPRPLSALLVARVPASATRALGSSSASTPLIVVIWPLANSSSASFVRPTDPVSTPAVPNPAVPLVMSSVD